MAVSELINNEDMYFKNLNQRATSNWSSCDLGIEITGLYTGKSLIVTKPIESLQLMLLVCTRHQLAAYSQHDLTYQS